MAARSTSVVRLPPRIDPRAVVHPSAVLGEGVEIGPYAIVGEGVTLGARTKLHAHAVVEGPTTLGEDNVVHSFAVVGGAPQAKRAGAPGSLVMGDRNVVREHVTIHRGTEERATRVGTDSLFMVGCHVAHDAVVGSHVTLANQVQLAGHAVVADHAIFGGLAGVAQFVKVGESAFVAAGSMCERDVPPFVIVQGDRARVRALNKVGLRRRGIDEASIARLEAAFRALYKKGAVREEAFAKVAKLAEEDAHVALLVGALRVK